MSPSPAGAARQTGQAQVLPDFIHWLVHDARIWVTETARAHPFWIFPLAFLIAFSESFIGLSIIVPGTLLLIALGGVIGASHLALFPGWAGTLMGSMVGDWISWWLGYHYHHKIVHFRLFRQFESHIEKALHLFRRWGTWGIIIGRFMGPLRGVVPLVSGMSEVPFWRFTLINTIAAGLWAYVLLAPGAEILRRVVP
jgi:membrane protein DedA with SNARE-associated domain